MTPTDIFLIDPMRMRRKSDGLIWCEVAGEGGETPVPHPKETVTRAGYQDRYLSEPEVLPHQGKSYHILSTRTGFRYGDLYFGVITKNIFDGIVYFRLGRESSFYVSHFQRRLGFEDAAESGLAPGGSPSSTKRSPARVFMRPLITALIRLRLHICPSTTAYDLPSDVLI
ncbi:hypothetical protein J6590_016363 [Homalodisca vitripennis]|nr:hypothetical protein J6590_016363 [Homalodisca vitripennis]